MTSYIIVSPTEDALKSKLQELCTIYSIDLFDQTVISPEKESSLGIEIIKRLQGKAILKPLKGKNKAVIITKSELLTIPAQNALLKLLEEPPNNTYIFLLTNTMDIFLPTIISRCQVITAQSDSLISAEEVEKLHIQMVSWQKLSSGDALKIAEKLAKDKEETINLLKKILIVGSSQLITNRGDQQQILQLAEELKAFQKAYKTLTTTNTNPRLILEHLFLSL